jgi:hypothetical protein
MHPQTRILPIDDLSLSARPNLRISSKESPVNKWSRESGGKAKEWPFSICGQRTCRYLEYDGNENKAADDDGFKARFRVNYRERTQSGLGDRIASSLQHLGITSSFHETALKKFSPASIIDDRQQRQSPFCSQMFIAHLSIRRDVT